MTNIYLSVADDFSYEPGSRYRWEGPFSAEEFTEEHVFPLFEEARQKGVKLVIDLDRTAGYATSFLEGTFGGLARRYGKKAVKESLEVVSNDDPYLLNFIYRYIDRVESVKVG